MRRIPYNRKRTILNLIGSVFVVVGILCNEWTVRNFFSQSPKAAEINMSWLFNALLIFTGLLLMVFGNYMIRKRREILLFCTVLVVSLLFAEYGIRMFYTAKYKEPPLVRSVSDEIGWEIDAHIKKKYEMKGYGEIEFSTQEYGFRSYGEYDVNKTKIFVLGDSYTEGNTVSDGLMYYDVMKKNCRSIEVFAYGCAGYSSLQEYLILERYYDMIQPDIVLWQFCTNDLLENEYELDVINLRDSRQTKRPYYIKDEIVILSKRVQKDSMRLPLLVQKVSLLSRLFAFEKTMSEDHPSFMKARGITEKIMKRVKSRVGTTPVISFCVDKKAWAGEAFTEICDRVDVRFIRGIPEAVMEAKKSGIVVDGSFYDSHWNKAGHSIAGEIILRYLIENRFVRDCARVK